MSERPMYIPKQYSPDAAQEVDNHSPYVVVRQTDENLKLFYHNDALDPQLLNNYLQEFTLPYLESAIGAIPLVKALANDMGVDDYRKIKKFIGQEGSPLEVADQIEAFDYTTVVFGAIPDTYRSTSFPKGLSRRGQFGAPTTISGFVRRINELHRVTTEITTGKVKKSNEPTYRPHLIRTEAFFDVAAKLPPPSVGEKGKLDLQVDTLTTMLEGIDIDLP